MYLKMVFIFAAALVFVLTEVLLFLFIWFAHTDFSTYEDQTLAGYLSSFNISDQKVIDFITTWYLAVVGFGWIGYNGLRILLIQQLATNEARERIFHEDDRRANATNQNYLVWCFCCLLGWVWWLVKLPFRALHWCLTKAANCGNWYCSFCCNCNGLLFCLNYSWRTLLFIPTDSVEVAMDLLAVIRVTK